MLATAGVTTDGKLSPFSNFLYPGAWTARRHSTYEVSSVEETKQKEKAKRGEDRRWLLLHGDGGPVNGADSWCLCTVLSRNSLDPGYSRRISRQFR